MFVKNEPVMKIGKTLIAADIHIGITTELLKSGFRVPAQAEAFAKRLNKIRKRTKAKELALLGDVKHSLDTRDSKELERFLGALEFGKITIIKGNHDGLIEKMTDIEVMDALAIGNCLLVHGHKNIEKGLLKDAETIVIGHNHPVIMFRDRMGAVYRERAWIIGEGTGILKGKRIVWMPAFNELCGGADVNAEQKTGRIKKKEVGLGPVASVMNMKKAKAHLLDGTDLGEIGKLMIKGSTNEGNHRR